MDLVLFFKHCIFGFFTFHKKYDFLISVHYVSNDMGYWQNNIFIETSVHSA